MRLKVRLDGSSCRRWHVRLLERLSEMPAVSVTVDARPGPGGLPRSAELLFQFEAAIHGVNPSLSAFAPPSELEKYTEIWSHRSDLTIDLLGDMPTKRKDVWRLTFDGEPGESALLGLLINGVTPVAAISEESRVVIVGRLGTESQGVMMLSFEDALARVITIILAAVSNSEPRCGLPILPELASDPSSAPLDLSRAGKLAAKQLIWTLSRYLYRMCCRTPHWRIGWRKLVGPDLFELRRHPEDGWQILPDDGKRFYADPFPIEIGGRTTLFVEDFEHKVGKGVISAVSFGPEGPIGRPTPVLERSYHLSYPFVFETDGEVWMIPESSGAANIELFRATRFPTGWVSEAILVPDITASDATLVEHQGRWWMFATVRDDDGAFSDALYLWSAPNFRGPWTAHRKNPVLVDIASARPAGRMVSADGQLLRPVQDCRLGYGASLAIARILTIDEDHFEQQVETILRPGPLWTGRKLHTLNSAGGFEFIDGSAQVWRWS
jgi:hypothetical protein